MRLKVVEMMKLHLLQYSIKPSGEQLTAVCRALIAKYPKLADTVGSDIVRTGYYVWLIYQGMQGRVSNSDCIHPLASTPSLFINPAMKLT